VTPSATSMSATRLMQVAVHHGPFLFEHGVFCSLALIATLLPLQMGSVQRRDKYNKILLQYSVKQDDTVQRGMLKS